MTNLHPSMRSSLLQRLRSLVRRDALRQADGRIGVVIELASFDKGGMEKVALDQAMALDQGQFAVTIVVVGKVGHLGRLARQEGVHVEVLPDKNPTKAYDRLLRKLAPRVAISHFSRTGYPLFRRHGIANITFIHNVYAFFSDEMADAFEADDRFVDQYISVSPNATRYAVENLGVPVQKIEMIPNGLIIGEHERREHKRGFLKRSDLGLLEADYVFANVASYNLHKGHYLMADAMRRILETRRDIKIVCVGNVVHEPHLRELSRYLAEEGLTDHILMPGFFANVGDVHQVVDAFLLPSFIEGWSIAMNEAMFHEKPMILTDTGASAEVIENEDIGILIPNEYGDTNDLTLSLLNDLTYSPRRYNVAPRLAAAMVRMADDRDVWREKAKAGRQKIVERYDFASIVRRHETIIQAVAGGIAPGRQVDQ